MHPRQTQMAVTLIATVVAPVPARTTTASALHWVVPIRVELWSPPTAPPVSENVMFAPIAVDPVGQVETALPERLPAFDPSTLAVAVVPSWTFPTQPVPSALCCRSFRWVP